LWASHDFTIAGGFTPFASGTFSLYTPGNPVTTGTTISSTWAINTLSDIATGLTTCVLKDGSQTMTANLPMANFRITGLGAASASTDAARANQVQGMTYNYLTSVAGTNTVTGSVTFAPTYAVGQVYWGIAAATNTGATTLNISGAGAGAVQYQGAALQGGELVIGMPFCVLVSAATPVFQLISPMYGTPINSQSAAYEFAFADSGKTILHPTADNNPRTFTIPSNASVALPVGMVITGVNQINTVTIAITSDTLTLAGTSSTGSRSIAANGVWALIKAASTAWFISGSGVS